MLAFLITLVLTNVVFTWLKISFLSQLSLSNASIQEGYLILICETGNSKSILPKISFMLFIVRLEQSIGITETLYFSWSALARVLHESDVGSLEFNTITNGLFKAVSSLATLSSAET